MNKKNILAHSLAFAALTLPALALAHGGVDDGHTDAPLLDAVAHKAGSSELLKAGSAAWWGIMAVSVSLMSALSYGVYHFIQVAPVVKAKPEEKK